MTDDFVALAGDRVMDSKTGAVICHVLRDIRPYDAVAVNAFGDFAEGEKPWKDGDVMDHRCTRPKPHGGWQLFVEGEWRP